MRREGRRCPHVRSRCCGFAARCSITLHAARLRRTSSFPAASLDATAATIAASPGRAPAQQTPELRTPVGPSLARRHLFVPVAVDSTRIVLILLLLIMIILLFWLSTAMELCVNDLMLAGAWGQGQ